MSLNKLKAIMSESQILEINGNWNMAQFTLAFSVVLQAVHTA